MKKTLTITILAIVLSTMPALARDAIRIATEGAYKPYNYKDASGKLVGFEIDLAAELCKRMNIKCTVVEQAWEGIIPALLAKRYDAIMAGMSVKPEREQVISFSRDYAVEPIRFAVLKSSKLASFRSGLASITLEDVSKEEQDAIDALKTGLQGLTVGVQAATSHEDFMKQYMPDIALKSYDTVDNMILDLESGRIDAAYTAVSVMLPSIETNNEIVMIGPQKTGGPLGLGVAVGLRKKDNDLREKFSTAIKSMIDDGSLKKLAIQWFGFDASAQ